QAGQSTAMGLTGKRLAIICSVCGSDEVSRDAWANWDTRQQEWVLGAVFDYAHCHRCDRERSLIEVELETVETVILSR
ncbi:MAG TPA: hypothetical protein VF631_08450, partial [Allosphingosinicella sp.]